MRSKLAQRIKEYLEYTKSRKDISRERKNNIEDRLGYMLPDGSFEAGQLFNVDAAKYIWNIPPKLLFDIMSKHPEYNHEHRLCAIEDIDNPTDEEFALLIDNGHDLCVLGICIFLYGKQKTYEKIFKVAKKIEVPCHDIITVRQEIFDFLAAVPQEFADKIERLDTFFGMGTYTSCLKDHKEFDELCQKNPIYYRKLLEVFITSKSISVEPYREAINSSEISDLYKQCFIATRCCNKRGMTSTDKKFLKNYTELSGLLRLYNYNCDSVIGCLLDNSQKEDVK
jgi:hypothetical protein